MIDQYNNKGFRFILVAAKGKNPIERDWTTKNNYPISHPKIKKHVKNKGNIGVLCGCGGLCVIDIDNSKLLPYVRQLPKTFQVITGSGGLHIYYKCPELQKKIIFYDKKEHLGEIQSHGTQIIAAGSTHPSGKRYLVYRDLPIKTIKLEQLKKVFERFIGKEEPKAERKIIKGSGITSKIVEKVSIIGLAKEYGFDVRGNKAVCKFHNDTKPSMSFEDSKGLFYCHGCNIGGNIVDFLALCKEKEFKKIGS